MHKLMLRAVDVNSTADLSFLYSVLSRRLGEPKTNISHKELPKYEEHCLFVQNKPYLAHYVIQNRDLLIGAAYLTHNREIGIWIAPEYRREGIGAWALRTLMRLHQAEGERWLANINPENYGSKTFFARHGFTDVVSSSPLQVTYALAGATPG